MADRKRTFKLVSAYAAFASFAFLFFLYVTFPYDVVRQRLVAEAGAAGYDLHVGGLGPGLLGVTATEVLVKSRTPPAEGQPERGALVVDKVALRPALLPPGLAFRASLMDGVATGSVGGLGDVKLRVNLDELDLSKGNLQAFSGLDLAGTLSGRVDLSIPKAAAPAPGGGKGPEEPDLGQASGEIVLDGNGVVVNGGTITVPMYGTPTPMDLPRIAFGDVDGRLAFDKGAGTLEQFEARSDDLTLMGSGTLKLAKRPEFSDTNIDLRFKAEPEFMKRLGMVAAGLSMLKADPQDPSFRVAKVTGFIGRPNFR